ncbi:endolytic transglycosylase MltG [Paenibacillus piri]|uniref:Endolytic murein transglycosylase n=1 Tax=Paenibacillus piri TaxID=2547395 RepID=A0A4R5KQ58_9BACL|nr:endolytic transglycosylase MltG [Paenibacillus piri]TDF97696.1 endolytic transglycosylase MltG [Paenibacillus piri]
MVAGKRISIVTRIVVTVLILGAAGLTGIGLYVWQLLQPMPASEQAVRVQIVPGIGSAQIAQTLERQGLIRDAGVFSYYLKVKQQGGKFQAGEYELAPGITNDAIIDTLNKGLTVKEQGIKLTVPEGFTVRQIADKVGQQFGLDPASFMQAAQQFSGFTAKAFGQIPADPQLRSRLEGYLFPETYEWKKDIKVEEMIDMMMLELDKKLASLPDNWQQTLAARGQSFHQMMTVASLIEREVVVEDERALVSGVIQNRLNKKMPLQIDATVQYMFDKPKERLLEKDLQVESPYNSYLHAGLPPGPIASPSLASIKAAIYPADTKYMFYVTKKDGSKAHLFAETYEQHQHNIAESKKNSP